ncbi:hypothetical protein GCM10023185_20220 [Hymenobacter saemangeumensis]|uniref:Thioredoxin n=1 Tax=Hymenobacter saemangeumensis TaxID=1084522 RepID=A0ABP8IDK7_9BACT
MPAPLPAPAQPTDAAVLLVLLPPALGSSRAAQAATMAALKALQRQLGASIRVLKIDEASHPAVVSSFQATELPAFVLVRRGVELWRQQGLPEGEAIVPLLLSKVQPVVVAE